MIINVDAILVPTLERLAGENKLTPEQYAGNIVKSFLEGQYKGELLNSLKFKSISELKDILTIKPK